MSLFTLLDTIGIRITAVDAGVTKVINSVVGTIEKGAARAAVAGTALSLGVTTPLIAMGKTAVASVAQFDQAMTKAVSIMDNVSSDMRKQLEANADTISRSSATSAADLAGGYQELASAGLSVAASLEALGTVEKFATAGAFDLAKSTELLTGTMGALGKDVNNLQQMKEVADVLAQAGNIAALSPAQAATSLTTKSGSALRLQNKDMKEGVAVIMAYAAQNIKAEAAGEKLAIVLRDLSRASREHTAVWESRGLKVFDDQTGAMRKVADIVADLEDRWDSVNTKANDAMLAELGFTDMSVNAIKSLIGFSDAIRANEKALEARGVVERVAAEQMKSLSNQYAQFRNNVNSITREIGSMLIPMLKSLGGMLTNGLTWWRAQTAVMKENIMTIGILAAAAGPAFLAIAAAVRVLSFALNGLGLIWSGVAGIARASFASFKIIVLGINLVVAATKAGIAWTLAEWAVYKATYAQKMAYAAAAGTATVLWSKATVAANTATAASMLALGTTASVVVVQLLGYNAAVWSFATATAGGVKLLTTTAFTMVVPLIGFFGAVARAADMASASMLRLTTTAFTMVPANISAAGSTTALTLATSAQTIASGAAATAIGAQTISTTALTVANGGAATSAAAAGAASGRWVGILASVGKWLAMIGGFLWGIAKIAAAAMVPVLAVVAKVAAIGAAIVAAVLAIGGAIAWCIGGTEMFWDYVKMLGDAWTAVKETVVGFWIITTEFLDSMWTGIKEFFGFTSTAAAGMDEVTKATKAADAAAAEAAKQLKAAEEAQAKSSEEARKAMELAEKAAKDAQTAMDKLGTGAGQTGVEQLTQDVNDLTKSLKEQVATFGMNSHQADVYKLKMAGATDAQLAEANALAVQLKALEDNKAAQEKHKEAVEEGRRVTEQYMTPQEKFQKTHRELSGYLNIGAINMKTYERAIKAAQTELNKETTVRFNVTGVDAVAMGSAAAMARLQEFRSMANTPDAPAIVKKAEEAKRTPIDREVLNRVNRSLGGKSLPRDVAAEVKRNTGSFLLDPAAAAMAVANNQASRLPTAAKTPTLAGLGGGASGAFPSVPASIPKSTLPTPLRGVVPESMQKLDDEAAARRAIGLANITASAPAFSNSGDHYLEQQQNLRKMAAAMSGNAPLVATAPSVANVTASPMMPGAQSKHEMKVEELLTRIEDNTRNVVVVKKANL